MLLAYLCLFPITARGLSITFCSTQNTGGGSSPTFDHYQSNGACQNTCQGSYAYAILQDYNCWCSNYAPGDQTNTGSCNVQCPGFPNEQCGNSGQGLFGYYQLGNVKPSGTQGASPSAAPSSTAPSSSPQESPPSPGTVTVQATITDQPHPSISVSVYVSSAPPSSAPPPPAQSTTTEIQTTTQAPPSSSPQATPTPSTVVTTLLGSIQTVIITPTLPQAPAQTSVTTVKPTPADNGFFSDTGKVAGTFTAVAVVVAALIGLLIWFFIRRSRSHESIAIRSTSDGDTASVSGMPFGSEKRNSKLTLSTAGLGGVHRGNSNDKSTAENTPASMSRRASMPLVHDQRLDPRALFNLEEGNGSHISVGSLRDDRDYSRSVLHIRNPD